MSESDDLSTAGSKSRRKLIMLIALVVLFILGVGGYATYAYLFHKWPFADALTVSASSIAGNAATKQAATQTDLTEQYIRFDTAFTFNLPGKTARGHMVQVEVVLVTQGAQNAALAQQHLPLISATISEICSQQDYESLASPSGRQRFKSLLLDGIRTKLTGMTNEPIIDQVLFTNFVMQ